MHPVLVLMLSCSTSQAALLDVCQSCLQMASLVPGDVTLLGIAAFMHLTDIWSIILHLWQYCGRPAESLGEATRLAGSALCLRSCSRFSSSSAEMEDARAAA